MSHIEKFLYFFFVLSSTFMNIDGEIASRPVWNQHFSDAVYYSYMQPSTTDKGDKVNIQLFYECLCPDCRQFDTSQFKEVVLKLSNYLNIWTYPYGNAQTYEENGKYKFKCQHGPEECYGNKLHACALHILKNQTEALLFNSCMMDYSQNNKGSDDNAAIKCGALMNINSQPIIACAKSKMGTKLLKYYGDESKKINYQYVPYILINGKENDGNNFMRDVCAAFANPPPPCASVV